MIKIDEDALICDLAEVYHIYDYRLLPVRQVATFSVGLRDNSRIKMKLNNCKVNTELLIMAGIYDGIKLLVWMNSKDGANGINRPKSMTQYLLNGKDEENKKNVVAFKSGVDFDKARAALIERMR